MSALLQVAELNAAYAATIDADRLEAWPDFFVENCLYRITSADNRKHGYSAGIIYADSRAMLHDRVTAIANRKHLRTAQLPPHRRAAVIGEPGDDGLAAETPFVVARIMREGRTDLFATGIYVDRIRLRFQSVTSSAIAAGSIRCWLSRFRQPIRGVGICSAGEHRKGRDFFE